MSAKAEMEVLVIVHKETGRVDLKVTASDVRFHQVDQSDQTHKRILLSTMPRGRIGGLIEQATKTEKRIGAKPNASRARHKRDGEGRLVN